MITIDYNTRKVLAGKLWQYDYGQVLRIQGGNLNKVQEIQFALEETGAESLTRFGVTKDGVTDVVIPDVILENNDCEVDYPFYVFIYNRDETSGETVDKFVINVLARSKPEHTGGSNDGDTFGKVIEEVNNAAERAESSEQQSAKHAEQTKLDAQQTTADRQEVERLVDSVSGIEEQVEAAKDYSEQAKTAATNALQSEQKSNEAKESALQAQAGAETAEGMAEQHALEVAGDKAEVERLATQVRQDKTVVEQTKTAVDKTAQDFTLTAQQAMTDVNNAGQQQTERVQSAGDTGVKNVEGAKIQAVGAVDTAKSDAVKAVQAEGEKQVESIQAKGQEVIDSIPEDFQAQMETKLDKQQGTEHAGKTLVIGEDGSVAPGEVKSGGMKLLVRYTHTANGSMKLSNLDLQTGIFTTSEPHGLKENTALYIKPLAGCYPKHIPIEIFKNNPGQWGRGNIYAHVIDETNFQILSKKDGEILLFTNATNSEVDIKYFMFEYNMKKITLDNINSRVIDVVANGICSGGYFAVKATTNYGSTCSTRTSSNLYSFFNSAQTSGHFQYACRMVYNKDVITSTIPIVAMAVDGTSYVSNNVNKIGRQYVRAVCGMGMEANPNTEREDGYIKSIQPFAEEVYPFNGAYVEVWGCEE